MPPRPGRKARQQRNKRDMSTITHENPGQADSAHLRSRSDNNPPPISPRNNARRRPIRIEQREKTRTPRMSDIELHRPRTCDQLSRKVATGDRHGTADDRERQLPGTMARRASLAAPGPRPGKTGRHIERNRRRLTKALAAARSRSRRSSMSSAPSSTIKPGQRQSMTVRAASISPQIQAHCRQHRLTDDADHNQGDDD